MLHLVDNTVQVFFSLPESMNKAAQKRIYSFQHEMCPGAHHTGDALRVEADKDRVVAVAAFIQRPV